MHGTDRKRVSIARRLRSRSTNAESRLWAELRNRQIGGFKFVRQMPIGSYIADVVCREALLIIEVDGAAHSTNEEIIRDTGRTAFLEHLGYALVRVQDDDVYNAMEEVLRTIQARRRVRPSPQRATLAGRAVKRPIPSGLHAMAFGAGLFYGPPP